MHRPVRAASGPRHRLLRSAGRFGASAVLVATVFAVPPGAPSGLFGPAPARAAAACTGWTSDSTPPTTIRVLRTTGPAAGSVQVVPFHDYVTVVMAAEWGPNDPAEALKAGAIAVKQYGWYHALYWRGGTAADGSCYDVVDSPIDQVYAPETETPSASEIAAVDATWGESLRKSGSFFATHYDAGADVACGANADGWHLYQVSAMHCAAQGMLADAILQTYYGPNLQIVGAGSGGAAVALRFQRQPVEGTAGLAFAVAPVVAVVDANGQTVVTGPASTTAVTLGLAANSENATLSCAGGPTRPAVGGVATFDGCAVNSAGSGYVLVASAAGLSAASSAPIAIAPAAPTLSMGAPVVVITWASEAKLTARLVPPASGASVANRLVELQRSVDGRIWTPAAQLVTDPSGLVSLVVRPATNLFYRAVFAGSPDLAPATSAVQRVLVRQLALLRPDNGGAVRQVTRGTTVTFTTLVRPARSELPAGRVEYRVYLLVGRTWALQRTATVTADAAGRTSFALTFNTRGAWYVRAIAVPTPFDANSVWSPVERYDVR